MPHKTISSPPSILKWNEYFTPNEIEAIKPDTLLVFDIDNTLIAPIQMLGSDSWYEHLVKSNDNNIDLALKDWSEVVQQTRVKLVDPAIKDIIQQLQARNIPIMGLTARPQELQGVTESQLESVGIQFHETHLKTKYGGVMFVGPHGNKGEQLKHLMNHQTHQQNIRSIIFFDDKQKHVLSVQHFFQESEFTVESILFLGAQNIVQNFDPKIAEFQWLKFKNEGILISDNDAQSAV